MNENRSMQTGGSKKTWVFDPASAENMAPIRNALTVRSAEDEFFDEEQGMTTLAIVMDKILDDLPRDLADAVRLVHIKGCSLRSAAKTLGVDHKTVKARVAKGLAMMHVRLVDSVWVAEMLRGYIPADEIVNTRVRGENVTRILKTLGDDDEQK
jgi:DNA-directed RNA polymerase specialized sigma24 family protein